MFLESNSFNKVIFLDIDGVLKPEVVRGRVVKDKYGEIFDQSNVDVLASIIEQTGAKIVISSTWKYDGLDKMKQMWNDRHLPGDVIDITPSEMDVVDAGIEDFYDLVKRGHEIQLWLNNNDFNGNYVIIDDIDDMLDNQANNFVKIDSRIRLNETYIDRIISILNRGT